MSRAASSAGRTGRTAPSSTPSRDRSSGSSPSAIACTRPTAAGSRPPTSTTSSGRCSRRRPTSSSRRSRRSTCPATRCCTSRAAKTSSSGRFIDCLKAVDYPPAVSPQRRTALLSVVAAATLIALKLGVGLASHSLGLLSEAAHSGTDLVAALLTFFAVGVAARPADVGHQYGHGKAEHLSALAEAAVLSLASLLIAWRAVARLTGSEHPPVDARWYAIAVMAVVIV